MKVTILGDGQFGLEIETPVDDALISAMHRTYTCVVARPLLGPSRGPDLGGRPLVGMVVDTAGEAPRAQSDQAGGWILSTPGKIDRLGAPQSWRATTPSNDSRRNTQYVDQTPASTTAASARSTASERDIGPAVRSTDTQTHANARHASVTDTAPQPSAKALPVASHIRAIKSLVFWGRFVVLASAAVPGLVWLVCDLLDRGSTASATATNGIAVVAAAANLSHRSLATGISLLIANGAALAAYALCSRALDRALSLVDSIMPKEAA